MTERREEKGWNRALRDWPEANAEEPGRDALVAAVTARIERGERGATVEQLSDEELFASPLPRSSEDADEPGAAAPSERRGRDRQNLKDLAKMAQELPGGSSSTSSPQRAAEAGKEDSGIIHLAAAAKADPAGEARAQTTPLASHDLFEETPSREAASVRREKPNVIVALFLTGAVALASTAAAAVFFVRTHATPTGPIAMLSPSASQAPPAVAAAEPIGQAPPPATGGPATDPNDLPAATKAQKLAAPKAKGAPDGRLAKAENAGKTTERDLAPAAPAGPTDLGSAIKREIGDDTKDKTPAAALTGGGDIPQRPSQGAVTGALGAVLSEARRCLGPDDPISRASIVFSSGGSVQSVAVTGPATGKPTEACIKDALGKAKVQPFAEPSYTANITIRHL